MSSNNLNLIAAFPSYLRDDALTVISALPEPHWSTEAFPVNVGGGTANIPYRIYHDPQCIDLEQFTVRQQELFSCLFMRHCNGYIRVRHLASIIRANNEWIPPFVVQLTGEYVIEILREISTNLDHLDPQLYRSFLTANPQHFLLTKQRVASYWNCYYRWQHRADYPGFRIVEFLERLLN